MNSTQNLLPTKIFSTAQIKAADVYTIANEPISSIDLMERASFACVNWIIKSISKENEIKVFCGHGNNGGDGLAIARLLLNVNYKVNCYLLQSNNYSDDNTINQQRLEQTHPNQIHYLSSITTCPQINKTDVVIDALLGTGLNKVPEGLYADVIYLINQSLAHVISIDVPSGLFCDERSVHTQLIAKANTTLSFQFPKLAFLFSENKDFVGNWDVLDIQLHPQFSLNQATDKYLLNLNYVSRLIKPRNKFSHKGTFGYGLIIAGSKGKIGAAVLSSKSFLRSGAGLLSVLVPQCGYNIIQTSAPEAMVLTKGIDEIEIDELDLSIYNSIAIGPGIGTTTHALKSVSFVLQQSSKPLVLDADALNCISLNKNLIKSIPKNSILTPHLKEFERLTKPATSDFERHDIQLEFSKQHNVYVVLKGAHTCITTPKGESYFNSTGNSGLAKGGSGDVLTGLITGLLAQHYDPKDAALIGVYLHGLAADITRDKSSEMTMLPSDVIENYSEAIKELKNHLSRSEINFQ